MQPEVIHGPAPVLPHHPARVRVIHHHDGAELLRQGDQIRQGGDVAVHTEHAVGNQQRPACAARRFQKPAGRGHVLMRIDLLLRTRQARPVDNAGMVQFVADDHIVLTQQRRHGPGVCGKSGLIQQGRLGVFETRQFFLQFLMDRHVAGDRPDRAGPHTQFINGAPRRCLQAGMVRQAEVVVRTEVDDLTAIIAGHRLLRPFQQPGPAEQPLLPQLIQLLVEIRQWIDHDSPEASRRPHT